MVRIVQHGDIKCHYIKKHDVGDAAVAIGAGCTDPNMFSWDGVNYAGLNWTSTSISVPTETQINNKIDELDKIDALLLLRLGRDKKLSDTDWVAIKGTESGSGIASNWKTYRQALRDLPSTANPNLTTSGELDYTTFTWPTEPT